MRRRTRARELALQFLYTLDTRGDDAREELDEFLKDSGASVVIRAYATTLVDGVRRHGEEIDGHISTLAENWKLERIAMLDRNILRLASFELLHGDVPPRVAINEAIELGKRYSTAQSGSFINGILDRVQYLRDDGRPVATDELEEADADDVEEPGIDPFEEEGEGPS